MKNNKVVVIIASIVGLLLGVLGIAVILDMLLLSEDIEEDSFEEEEVEKEKDKEKDIDWPLKRHYIEIPMAQRENR